MPLNVIRPESALSFYHLHLLLPSLEEIEEMDKQQSQAIESLQISGNSVKDID